MLHREPITSEACIPHFQQVRRLTISLIASVSANVILFALLIYGFGGGFLLSRCETSGRLWCTDPTSLTDGRTMGEALYVLGHMLPEQLVGRMNSKHQIEEGITERDLALGCLISLHYFDIAKALHGSTLPKAHQHTCSDRQIVCYPGLSDAQFAQIVDFLNSERWPLTSEGLFLALQRPSTAQDPTLMEAFFLTPEFLTLQRLFTRAESSVDRATILEPLLEGTWQMFQSFYQAALQVNETSPALRRRLLLSYVQAGSKKATYLLLKSDGLYASRNFDDPTVLMLLNNMDRATPEAETFVAELVHSPRTEQVLEQAQQLCSKALVAAVKEIEEKRPKAQPAREKIYVVQRGDSLWKISKQTKVSISELKAHNHLDSDLLRPGATLRIP